MLPLAPRAAVLLSTRRTSLTATRPFIGIAMPAPTAAGGSPDTAEQLANLLAAYPARWWIIIWLLVPVIGLIIFWLSQRRW